MDQNGKSSVDKNNDAMEVREKQKYPRSVAFIIGNEFCERFSYYGMRAILGLYFTKALGHSEDKATEFYHIFAMACYFTPVLGAIIADSLLGKFKTIFYISIIYAIGNVVLSAGSYWRDEVVTWVGLLAIALGTGGIKPCVSAFGGDQFGPGQEQQLQKFFSWFYVSINAGSLLSTFITPILREDVHCFGEEDCYPLAFGVPAVLMIVSLFLFILGKFLTNYKIIPPSKGNIVVQVVKCVFTALYRKLFKRMPKREHWLDYADDECDAQTLTDIKAVMRVLFLYLPLPIFWALYDQQGSRWTFQATRMNGDLFGVYRIKPDQIQVVNPILIIFMIPVFEYGIYPLFAKINLLKKPLQRITIGGILTAASFVICAFFQLRIETELPTELSSNSVHMTIVNGLSNKITFNNSVLNNNTLQELNEYDIYTIENANIESLISNPYLTIKLSNTVGKCKSVDKYNFFNTTEFNETTKNTGRVIVFITEIICDNKPVVMYDFPNMLKKPEEGGANIGLVFNIKNLNLNLNDSKNASFCFENEISKNTQKIRPSNISFIDNGTAGLVLPKELNVHTGGKYKLSLLENDFISEGPLISIAKDLPLYQGGSYLIVVSGDYSNKNSNYSLHEMVKPNSLSMFWQIIQYIVITGGEIMFSITGLEFSYSQAPKSMKSVLQAAWLITVAFGNALDAIIASAKIFNKQSTEFFFFAGLMVLDIIVFAIMAYFYVPYKGSTTDEEESDDQKSDSKGIEQNGFSYLQDKKGHNNEGFNDDTKF